MEIKKILITGAAGFIGYSLINRIISDNYDILGVDNINDYYNVNLKYARLDDLNIDAHKSKFGEVVVSSKYSNLRFIKLDITDNKAVDRLLSHEKFDVVINLAAQAGVRYSIENPKPYIDTNIVGYFNLLNASHLNDVKHFIYASSSSVYGLDNHFPYSENDQVDSPVSLYGATKKCNELIAHSYSYLYKMHTTGLRFFTVYGPFGRPDMAPIKFMKAIDEDRTLDVYNEGHLLRDFTYIDDIVEGVGKIIKSDVSNRKEIYKIYNIGNSSPVQLMDFIHTMEKIVGKEAKKNYLGMQDGDIYETYADVSQLEQDFRFHPSTTLYDGLSKLHDWFKSYKALL